MVLRRREDLPAGPQACLADMTAHATLGRLSLPDSPTDLLVCSGTGDAHKDRVLCQTLALARASHITSGLAINGILSAAPSLVDLMLARCALQAQSVPPIAGLQQPVANLPFIQGAPHAASLEHCLVLNRDDNGFSAAYQVLYSAKVTQD